MTAPWERRCTRCKHRGHNARTCGTSSAYKLAPPSRRRRGSKRDPAYLYLTIPARSVPQLEAIGWEKVASAPDGCALVRKPHAAFLRGAR